MNTPIEDRLRDALRTAADRTTTQQDALGQIIRRAGDVDPASTEVRGAAARVAAVAAGLLLVGAVVAVVAFARQEPDHDGGVVATAPSTSSPADDETSSTSGAVSTGDCPHRPTGSSPAVFDHRAGTYAAQDLAFDPQAQAIDFDVVQWLVGDDARAAYFADNPQVDPSTRGEGPPGDYYIADESDAVRTAAVRPDVQVRLTHLANNSDAAVEPDTLVGLVDQLAAGHAEAVFWLTFEAGSVVEICEQYRP